MPSLEGRGRFPKSSRVLTKREYDRIHRQGTRVHRPDFTIVCARSTRGPRFGCAVSRKVGNAVVRNRLKRLMREVFRQSSQDLPSVDLVVILRPSAAGLARGGLVSMAEALLPAWSEAIQRVEKTPPRKRRRSPGGSPRTKPRSSEEDERRRR